MKEYTLTLTPKNKYYPNFKYTGTDEVVDVSKLYKDTYQLHVDSDWYVPYAETYIHTKQHEKVIPLKVGESKYRFTYATTGQPSKSLAVQPMDMPVKLRIDGKGYPLQTIIKLPYKDDPYHIKIEKDHYHTHEMEVDSINDHAFKDVDEHSITLKRKTGVWVDEKSTKPIPFETETIKDKDLLPEDSYNEQNGANGVLTITWQIETIDGKPTNAETPRIETVTTPPRKEIRIQGTMVLEWKKELVSTSQIKFTRETREDNSILPSASYVQRAGKNGEIRTYHEVEYKNGTKTGRTRNRTTERTEPINEIYIQGTLVIEWKKETYRTEVIPITPRYIYTDSLFEDEEEVRENGQVGLRTYYREYEYRNGIKSGEWRNETNAVTRTMEQRVVARGLKPRYVEWTGVGASTSSDDGSRNVYFRPKDPLERFPNFILENIEALVVDGVVVDKRHISNLSYIYSFDYLRMSLNKSRKELGLPDRIDQNIEVTIRYNTFVPVSITGNYGPLGVSSLPVKEVSFRVNIKDDIPYGYTIDDVKYIEFKGKKVEAIYTGVGARFELIEEMLFEYGESVTFYLEK